MGARSRIRSRSQSELDDAERLGGGRRPAIEAGGE